MNKFAAVSLNQLVSKIIVDLFYQNGIDQFFISPGSRSTPLTTAVAENDSVKKIIHFDERGAAFAALGFGRGKGKPAVLICTSGTAAANYYPAVIEASNDRVPLIVLSADRPPELLGVNANQTIDQIDLFGNYPRCFVNLEPPEESKEYFSNLISSLKEAITHATDNPSGPVHINAMFREPLAPLGESKDFSGLINDYDLILPEKAEFETNFTLDDITCSENILLVAGYQKDPKNSAAVLELAQRFNLPLLADIRSGLRTDHPNIVSSFDQILLSQKYNQLEDLSVIHFGGNLVSKRYLEFIERSDIKNYLHCDNENYTYNPHNKTTKYITAPYQTIIRALENKLTKNNDQLLMRYQKANQIVKEILNDQIDNENILSEIKTARCLSQNLSFDNCLYLGSSMPVRDYDMYADPAANQIPVAANRGASGIDGSIATALGFALAHNKKGIALVGDLAFLHDLNSLSLVKKSGHPLLIIVINNDGGGIFSFLPIAQCDTVFEPYFGTPHGYTFKAAAELFGLDYHLVDSSGELKKQINYYNQTGQSTIVEIKSNRDENIKLHNQLAHLIKDKLS